MILAQNLSKRYGKIIALYQVSLEVKRGEICGILGPNGAGKTTLFKILCGLISPDAGDYEIRSHKKKTVGAIIEKPSLFEYLSARENISILSRMQGADRDNETINGLLVTVGLSVDRNDPVKNFSLGMKQRLGLAIALINEPDCLILDEPFLGLDPVAMNALSELIINLAHNKRLAIIISSHLLGELTKTCDSLKIIKKGKIVQSGSTSDILNSSTKRYMICGKALEKSKVLKDHCPVYLEDCISLDLEVKMAPDFLKSMVSEGNEITYFGPEMNLSQLYGEE